jgi:hypothetical protein
MNPLDPTVKSDLTSPDSSAPGDMDLSLATVKATHDILPTGRLVAVALVAGVLAGVLAWGIGERVYGIFVPPSEVIRMAGQTVRRISFEDQAAADTKNAALAFAALGGVLGVFLGAAGGIVRKSALGVVKGAITGLVLGAAVTTGATWGLLRIYFRALERSQEAMSHDLLLPLLIHSGIWATAGLAGGVALAIGLGVSWPRLYNAALGGLIGAALGAVVYEVVGAVVLPGDRTAEPVAVTWQGRILARFLVAVFAAVLAALVMNSGRKPAGASAFKG